MTSDKKLITRDWLAIERTKLANERTFLSYFRTAFVLFGTGLSILKIDYFSQVRSVGILLLAVSLIVLLFGIIRLFQVRKGIQKHYKITTS